jgi:hypothetical protein
MIQIGFHFDLVIEAFQLLDYGMCVDWIILYLYINISIFWYDVFTNLFTNSYHVSFKWNCSLILWMNHWPRPSLNDSFIIQNKSLIISTILLMFLQFMCYSLFYMILSTRCWRKNVWILYVVKYLLNCSNFHTSAICTTVLEYLVIDSDWSKSVFLILQAASIVSVTWDFVIFRDA